MKLVREIEFEAATENEAYNKVKARLGLDGVILSMQSVKVPSVIPFFHKTRIAVRAGILEEERKIHAKADPELEKRQMEVFQALLQHKRNSGKKSAESLEPSISVVEKPPRADGMGSRDPEFGTLLEHEVPLECSEKLWGEYLHSAKKGEPFSGWLNRKAGAFCPPDDGDPFLGALGGRKVMIVGPTGVGKTTTIAKIAAMAVMEGRDVALFTSDNYRVSAVDQIRTFARVLGIPVEVVNEGTEIPRLVEKYPESTHLLMDTAGCGFRDDDRLSGIREIYRCFRPDAVHMAISGTSRLKDVKAAMDKAQQAFPLSRVILTKLDETLCLGASLWLPMEFGLPFSFLTTGQNVPRDIHLASGAMIASGIFGGGRGL